MEEREEMILKVALELFLEKGYENTNMKDIVDKVGGSYATIYKRFGNKNQLFLATLELRKVERIGKFINFIKINQNLDLDEFLDTFGFEYFNFFCNQLEAKFLRLVVARSYQDKTLQEIIKKADKNIINRELAVIFENKIDKEVLKKFSAIKLACLYCSMIRADNFVDLFFDSGREINFDTNEVKNHVKLVNKFFLNSLSI